MFAERNIVKSMLKSVGLHFAHEKPGVGDPVALDEAISRPRHAHADYLYGLYGDGSKRAFLHALANSNRSGRPCYEHTKLIVDVPHDPCLRIDADRKLEGLQYLGENARAEFRKAFQAHFRDVVLGKYGGNELSRREDTAETAAGFRTAVLAFPDCIAATMDLTDIVVAVVPMQVKFDLVLPMSIVAKRAVSALLASIKTDCRGDRAYYVSSPGGVRLELMPPVQQRPTITISGRAGTKWRKGVHHPNGAGLLIA